jgi:hypothetical protein
MKSQKTDSSSLVFVEVKSGDPLKEPCGWKSFGTIPRQSFIGDRRRLIQYNKLFYSLGIVEESPAKWEVLAIEEFDGFTFSQPEVSAYLLFNCNKYELIVEYRSMTATTGH